MTVHQKETIKDLVFELAYQNRAGMINAILKHGKNRTKSYIRVLAAASEKELAHVLQKIIHLKIDNAK
jgi:hypothetical protein